MSNIPDANGHLITDKLIKDVSKVEELAYELKVSEVMTPEPKVITDSMLMQDVLELFRQNRISGAPVVKNDHLIGLVSMQDLINCLQKSDLSSPATHYMSKN